MERSGDQTYQQRQQAAQWWAEEGQWLEENQGAAWTEYKGKERHQTGLPTSVLPVSAPGLEASRDAGLCLLAVSGACQFIVKNDLIKIPLRSENDKLSK